jgi:biopolymer transport protein ExbB
MGLDYRRALESRLAPAEAAAAEASLEQLDDALRSAPETLSAASLGSLLQLSLDRCTSAFGGSRSSGQAVDGSGTVLDGTFITVGPLSFFQSVDGVTGLAFHEVGSLRPTLYSAFSGEQHAALRALFATGAGRVPVDVTMGSGVQLEQARETLAEHLRKGGLVMVPLLGLGLVCALIVLYKLIQVSRLATATCQARVPDIVAAVTAGDMARAERLADSLRLPLRPVIREGLSHRHATREQLEEILYEQVLAQVPALERFLGVLAVGTGAAPLLGLLGTVTGMIHTFRLITVFGTGDARLLSSGISEALITTEVGLVIAIPTLLCHAYLSRRVRRMVGMVQEAAAAFVNGVTQGAPPA